MKTVREQAREHDRYGENCKANCEDCKREMFGLCAKHSEYIQRKIAQAQS